MVVIRIKRLLEYCALALILIYSLLPIYWIVNTAFKTNADALTHPPQFLPLSPTLQNFMAFFATEAVDFANPPFLNSLVICFATVGLVLLLGVPAAYSLTRFANDIKRSKDIGFFILAQRMFPSIVIIIPYFIMMQSLKLVDTHLSLILLYTSFNLPFAVWLLKSFFSDLPWELEEAAMTDGAKRWFAFLKVMLPVALPGIITSSIFVFMFSWSEFLGALILTNNYAVTMPVAIAASETTSGRLWGNLAATGLIGIIPCFVLALYLQKYIVRGLTLGAVKG